MGCKQILTRKRRKYIDGFGLKFAIILIQPSDIGKVLDIEILSKVVASI